ncbi:MAG: efflux RND transporter periplasmic adaptor subunit [Fibrella sp.]|nr:efflux RND transporter periplasmic adaptor subunit [Armatimonadota bacterium]
MIFFSTVSSPASAGNHRTITGIVAAFFIGVALTIWGMTQWRNTQSPKVLAVSAEPHAEEHEHGNEESSSTVHVSPEGANAIGVRVAPVAHQDLRESLTAPAVVEASTERVAKVTPPVAGKLLRLFVKPGDTVEAGRPVAVLDSYEIAQAHAAEDNAEASISQATASLQTVRAEAEQAQTRLQNALSAAKTQRELVATGVFAQTPLQEAKVAVAEAETDLLVAAQEQETDEVQLARAERLLAKGIVSQNAQEQARLEVRQDEARVKQAKVRVNAARIVLTREEAIAKSGLRNRQALQSGIAEIRDAQGVVARAKREELSAQATLTAARQALAGVRSNLDALEGSGHIEGESSQITLYAPFDGVVSSRFVTVGETVERSTPLLQIENLSTVLVVANVAERDVARVRPGSPVAVTAAAYPRERFSGRVESLATRVDEKTRTLAVRCRVANPSGYLRPEMFATVTLPVGQTRRAIAVPISAVVNDGETMVVFVAGKEPNEYEKRTVTRGSERGAIVEITGGLKPGESVVTEGAFSLLSESHKSELSGEDGHGH